MRKSEQCKTKRGKRRRNNTMSLKVEKRSYSIGLEEGIGVGSESILSCVTMN
jgi:hypothetical protein